MMDNKNKKLVRDCGVKASIVRSDHKGVVIKLNMKVKRLQKKPKDKRTVRINKDFSKLSLTAKSDQEREEREQYRAEYVEEVMKILRETKDMTTEEFAQYKSERAQASKEASKAREKGNVTEVKAEETESEPEAEEKADDASTENVRWDSWVNN